MPEISRLAVEWPPKRSRTGAKPVLEAVPRRNPPGRTRRLVRRGSVHIRLRSERKLPWSKSHVYIRIDWRHLAALFGLLAALLHR